MGFNIEQKIYVTWSARNKNWYVQRGYVFTKMRDVFQVALRDLNPNAKVYIDVVCDYCAKSYQLKYGDIEARIKRNNKNLIYCLDCKGKSIKEGTSRRNSSYNVIDIYKKALNNEIGNFPSGFVESLKIDELRLIMDHFVNKLIEDKVIDNIEEIVKIGQKTFKEYSLWTVQDKFGMFNLFNILYPDKWKPWQFSKTPNGFWNNEDNIKEALDWFFQQLVQKGEINNISELPKLKLRDKLKEYGLWGTLNKFNNSASSMIAYFYPEHFNQWDLCVPKNYYKDTENNKNIMLWLVTQLKKDKIIKSEEDIPKVAHRDLFAEYNLGSFLANCFNSSSYLAFDSIYPQRWNYWEFRHVPNDFWNDGKNVRNAIEWLIEILLDNKTIHNIEDLKGFPLLKVFREHGLSALYQKHDIPFLLTILYPTVFSINDFKQKIRLEDGTILDSKDEKRIHEYLNSKSSLVQYCSNTDNNKFYNKLADEYYIPDWIINGNIIIEYFGLFRENASEGYIKNYTKKTLRKINYYKSLDNYSFLAIYPNDLKKIGNGYKEKIDNLLK